MRDIDTTIRKLMSERIFAARWGDGYDASGL